MDRIKRLKRLIAIALGLYMARRIMGGSGDVQLKRYKKLEEEYGKIQTSNV